MLECLSNHYENFLESTLRFFTVYVRRYTDATYNEVGILMLFSALSGAFTKPLVCSVADRYRSYKCCLIANQSIMLLCTIPFAILPFRPQLFFEEPELRFNWYLLASIYFLYWAALGSVITLIDVYTIDRVATSGKNEMIGHYRFVGPIGWNASVLFFAFLEKHTSLPYLSMPMIICSIILVFDIIVVYFMKDIDTKMLEVRNSIKLANENGSKTVTEQKSIQSDALDNPKKIDNLISVVVFQNPQTKDSRGSNKRISVMEQVKLLLMLNSTLR